MRVTAIFRQRLRSLLARTKVDQELDEELLYHLERQIDEYIASGMHQRDARHAALRSIADIEQRKEECRDMRGWNFMDNLMQDFRYAVRVLRRAPGFALFAVLVMALGIGANTAVFSVVNGVLLKPLAYRDPDRMVTLTSIWKDGGKVNLVALPDLQDWHDQNSAFSAMAWYRSSDEPTRAGSAAEYVRVARISPEFLQVFAVEPLLGRPFSKPEQASGDSAVALISYSYWQSHFGQDSAILGRKLRVSDQMLTIVGVLPPRFRFPKEADIWRPLDAVDKTLPRTSLAFLAIARLKPNITPDQAQSQISALSVRLQQQYPDSNRSRSAVVTGMREDMVGDVRVTLYLLLGAVGLVMLIACANIATLLLTKATSRAREIAIRAAAGAGRGRIVRQLTTESLLLASVAGVLGLILAVWGTKALIALAPADLPRLAEATIDGRVLAFTFALSMACSLLFGLAPALQASRVDLIGALKQGGARTVLQGGTSRLRGALVIAEVALSVTLLAGAGLLLRSFVALNNVDLGFHPERLLLMKTSLPASGEQGEARAREFFKNLLSEVSTLPGVSAAGATMGPPGDVESAGAYWPDHMPQPSGLNAPDAVFSVVAPGTFAALGIPLKRGRDFDQGDEPGAPLSAIVNETLARVSFPNQDPIGRTIFLGFDSPKPMKIVGIAGDVRQWGPAKKPDAEIYMPYAQHTSAAGATLTIVVRTAAPPEALASTTQRIVRTLSPDAPVKFTTMEASLNAAVAAPRFRTLLLSIFAALSLWLAIAGVYGITSYVVGQRSGEIGLRMAMGATPSQVLGMILKQGAGLASAGIAVGVLGSLGASRLMRSMLFEVQPGDPVTFVSVAALLGLVVLCASYLPARRASRLDPLAALRQE